MVRIRLFVVYFVLSTVVLNMWRLNSPIEERRPMAMSYFAVFKPDEEKILDGKRFSIAMGFFNDTAPRGFLGAMERIRLFALYFVLSTVGLNTAPVNRPVEEPRPGAMRYFDVFKPDVKKLLNGKPYGIAKKFFNEHKRSIPNRRYLTIIDYSKPSYAERMYIIDQKTFTVEKCLVAHGKKSGSIYATRFSNRVDSLESSKGFFLTGEPYKGKHGEALLLHGLEPGVNDNAEKRAIVMHGAAYVSPQSILKNCGRLGRSWGCPAVPLGEVDQIVDKLKDGSLLYIYAGK